MNYVKNILESKYKWFKVKTVILKNKEPCNLKHFIHTCAYLEAAVQNRQTRCSSSSGLEKKLLHLIGIFV